MSEGTLEAALQAAGSPVRLARSSQLGAFVYPHVRSEFTNWRDEQRSWRDSCALFDQSHHMTDLHVEGPDVFELFRALGVNTFTNFGPNKAKQFVACNYDGYVIGDAILFCVAEKKVILVGRPSAHNWVEYQAEAGGYDVRLERDERTAVNPLGRRLLYRYQVQGPAALEVLAKATGKPLPNIRFFNIGEITVAGRTVKALHHGMAGAPGLEMFGPWEDAEDVKAAIVEAGREFGLQQVGSRVYATCILEAGWISCPLPAVFTGDKMEPYRRWLPADGYEATGSLGGSFSSEDISDYYLTPWDLGYGALVKFDHEFIGKSSLERMADVVPRRKVTLAWRSEDVAEAMGTLFRTGNHMKYIDLPLSNYATWPYDRVERDGQLVGLSTFSGYSYNERSMLSLAAVDNEVAIGDEVEVVWGEEADDSPNPSVERHIQGQIRAIVSPCPISKVARESYATGSRLTSTLS